jgi:hypothetical protein
VSPTPIPLPNVNLGAAASYNTIGPRLQTWIHTNWPALLGLCLLLLLACLALGTLLQYVNAYLHIRHEEIAHARIMQDDQDRRDARAFARYQRNRELL